MLKKCIRDRKKVCKGQKDSMQKNSMITCKTIKEEYVKGQKKKISLCRSIVEEQVYRKVDGKHVDGLQFSL